MLKKDLVFMNRCYNPKVIIYNSIGDGRDGYITSNNGGFYKSGFRNLKTVGYNIEVNNRYKFNNIHKYSKMLE